MLSIADGENVYVIEREEDVPEAIRRVNRARWVFHNASFDIPHLRRWADIPPRDPLFFWDTLIIERILWNGYYDDFGLKDLARRYLNIRMVKEQRKEFYQGDQLTEEMLEYGALDAHITWLIQQKQEQEVVLDPQLWEVWFLIDCPAFWAVQDFKGLTLDTEQWSGLASKELARAAAIKQELGFNPNSPKQALNVLKAEGKRTGNAALSRIANTREDTIKPFITNKIVFNILEYREAAKRASTYGDDFLKYVESDKRVHAGYDVTGAITGRMASHDPNQQNIPREKMYRGCFIAPKRRKLVIADVSAQEPKITAEASRDPLLLAAFEAGEDIHWTVTKAIFRLPDDAPVDKKLRAIGKAINLGMVYGLSARGLAQRTGLRLDEAEDLIERYFQRFRGVARWIQTQHFLVERDGLVRTLSGRRMFINPYSWQWPNHAVNMPIQGTAADQMKLALAWLHAQLGEAFFVDAAVHDEIVAECASGQAEWAADLLRQAFEFSASVLTPHVSTKNLTEVYIGTSWADKG